MLSPATPAQTARMCRLRSRNQGPRRPQQQLTEALRHLDFPSNDVLSHRLQPERVSGVPTACDRQDEVLRPRGDRPRICVHALEGSRTPMKLDPRKRPVAAQLGDRNPGLLPEELLHRHLSPSGRGQLSRDRPRLSPLPMEVG